MTARFIITIDGGYHRSTGALWTADGHLLSRSRAGACCEQLDIVDAIAAIDHIWGELRHVVGLDDRAGRGEVTISLATEGMEFERFRNDLFDRLTDFRRVNLSSTGYAALLGAFGGGPGSILIVDRGIRGCRMSVDGNFETLGGWGLTAAERGSGAWLGQQLLSDYLQHRDGVASIPSSQMWDQVEQRLGNERGAILNWLQQAIPDDFNQFVPLILEAADAGDAEALDLVEATIAELRSFAIRLQGDPPLPLQLAGHLGRALRSRLDLPEPNVRPSVHRGAYLIGTGFIAPEF